MYGEEHVIMKKNVPVVKIVPIAETLFNQSQELIRRTKEIRQSLKRVSIDELNEWKKTDANHDVGDY